MRLILVAAIGMTVAGCAGRPLPMMMGDDASPSADDAALPSDSDMTENHPTDIDRPLRLSAMIDQRVPRVAMFTAERWWSTVSVSIDDASGPTDLEISELLHAQLANLAGDPNAIGLTLRPGATCFAKLACVILDYEWMSTAAGQLQAEHIAHELGHALGLHDVDDPMAVMYSTPHDAQGLTATDVAEFHRARGN